MVKALFDTNILIDTLRNVDGARAELRRYDDRAISIVSWIEVMVGAEPQFEAGTREFLAEFELVDLDHHIADEAAKLRRHWRIKLPDAAIWASARMHDRLLVTRNTKDFPADDPGIRHPYVV